MNESVQETAIGKLSKALGGGWSREERNRRMFGNAPKGTYFNAPKDLSKMHDLTMSAETKQRLYGIGGGRESTVGEIVESRLGTDSKQGLVKEMVENSSLTRSEAEQIINRWMQANGLVEVEDATLGRIIVPRGSR
jgi:hypothetical protein